MDGSYTLTVTDDNGCESDPASVTVTVNALPTVTISPESPICSNDPPIPLTVSPTTGGSGNCFINGTLNANCTFDPSLLPSGPNQALYEFTETSTGCTNRDSTNITVKPTPDISTSNGNACQNETVVLDSFVNDQNLLTGVTTNFFETLDDAENNTNARSSSFTASNSGTEKFYVRMEKNGCFEVDSFTITVAPPPDPNLINLALDPDSVCTNEATTLSVTGLDAGVQYNVSYQNPGSANPGQIDDVVVTADALGNAVLPTNTFAVANTRTYSLLSVGFSGGSSCSTNFPGGAPQVNLEVRPRPNLAGADDLVEDKTCHGASPLYQIEGLESNTDYTFIYDDNGDTLTTALTTDGDGMVTLPTSLLLESDSVGIYDIVGIAFNDGSTNCAAEGINPDPNETAVRPDLGNTTLVGDVICADQNATLILKAPNDGERRDFEISPDIPGSPQ